MPRLLSNFNSNKKFQLKYNLGSNTLICFKEYCGRYLAVSEEIYHYLKVCDLKESTIHNCGFRIR